MGNHVLYDRIYKNNKLNNKIVIWYKLPHLFWTQSGQFWFNHTAFFIRISINPALILCTTSSPRLLSPRPPQNSQENYSFLKLGEVMIATSFLFLCPSFLPFCRVFRVRECKGAWVFSYIDFENTKMYDFCGW